MTSKLHPAHALLVLALLLANVWPAVYNRQPFFYADTTAYIRVADAGSRRLTGHATAWSQDDSATSVSQNSVAARTVLSGRSVYYGALLYLSHLAAATFWPVVLIQSAIVLLALALTLDALVLFSWPRFAAIVLLLDAFTPMPFFISFLDPDIFAAITILAIVALLIDSTAGSRPKLLIWTTLLTAALLFHISDVPIALVLFVLTPSAMLLSRVRISRIGIAAIACSLALAFAGEFIFNTAVNKLLGAPPLRSPVLTARLIEDGPGYRYLLASCPASGFEVCQFLSRLPVAADPFLWDNNPNTGIFAVASPSQRRALSNEQYRFAWAVFRSNPLGTLAGFFRDWAIQLTRIGYAEFNCDAGAHEFFHSHLPAGYYDVITHTRAWTASIPAKLLTGISAVSTCLALCAIAYALLSRRARFARTRAHFSFIAFLCLGVIVNAAVCALAPLHDRYQMRVLWLLPFAAMLLYLKPSPSAAPPAGT